MSEIKHMGIQHDYKKGGSWVRTSSAMSMEDEAEFRDLAKRFPKSCKVRTSGFGRLELWEKTILVGSPDGKKKKKHKKH